MLSRYPKVSIIVLNWNGWEHTIECLESVYQNTYPNYEVVVVDNASTDDSIEKIKEYAAGHISISSPYVAYDPSNKPIHVVEYTNRYIEDKSFGIDTALDEIPPNKKMILIKNDENYGFAEGNNIGIRYALKTGADYILLLNNDTVVDKDFLSELVKVMESNKKIGIAGSKILDYNNPSIVQCTGGYINWWLGNIKEYKYIVDNRKDKENIIERDFVWATSVLIKREVFETVGLLDPFFFFGIEEYDFCTRAKKGGFRIVYVPKSKIWHKGRASSTKLRKYPELKRFISKQRGFLYYKHYHRLFQKHLPPIIYLLPFSIFMAKKFIKAGIIFTRYLISGNMAKIRELSKEVK